MSHLWKYFRGYRIRAIIAPFFKLAEALLELFIPYIVADIIDDGVKAGLSSVVLKKCGLMVLLGIIGMLLSVTSQYFSATAAVGFSCALRKDAFAHVNALRADEKDRAGSSALLTRLSSDIDKLQNGVNIVLRLLLRSPFIVFGSVVMALVTDPKAGLWFVAALPVLSVIIFTVVFGGVPIQTRVGKKLDKLTLSVRENLNGVRVIRAFGKEKSETEKFDKANGDHSRAVFRSGLMSSVMNPLTFAVINVLVILVIKTGAEGVTTGRLTGGQVVALYNYTAMVLVELVKLASFTLTASKALSCAKRISSMLDLGTDDLSQRECVLSADGPVLEFKDVSFRYRGASADALEHVSFTLGRGESLGIIGGTGSGKTTAASLITGMYAPTAGEITVCGRKIGEIPLRSLREFAVYVPQTARLFAGTVAENIRWGKKDATDEEICEALRAADAYGFVAEKEGGINCRVEQGGKNFSGGQRQRLTIARALISSPSLLIMDDSFSALDYRTERTIRDNIKKLPRSSAVIVISQRPASVMGCDRILVLEDGHAEGLGNHEQLLEKCPVYREIYGSQYGEEAAE